jgi:hypothetical protein
MAIATAGPQPLPCNGSMPHLPMLCYTARMYTVNNGTHGPCCIRHTSLATLKNLRAPAGPLLTTMHPIQVTAIGVTRGLPTSITDQIVRTKLVPFVLIVAGPTAQLRSCALSQRVLLLPVSSYVQGGRQLPGATPYPWVEGQAAP